MILTARIRGLNSFERDIIFSFFIYIYRLNICSIEKTNCLYHGTEVFVTNRTSEIERISGSFKDGKLQIHLSASRQVQVTQVAPLSTLIRASVASQAPSAGTTSSKILLTFEGLSGSKV